MIPASVCLVMHLLVGCAKMAQWIEVLFEVKTAGNPENIAF